MAFLKTLLPRLGQFIKLPKKASPTIAVPADPSIPAATTATVDPRFTPEQRQEIDDAMGVIFGLFGGADKFYASTGIPNLEFVCTTKLSCNPENAVACYVGKGVIEMTAAAFNPAPLVTGWYIAHEVGHAFDFSHSGGKPQLYRSHAFVEHFVPKNWLQRLLRMPIKKVASNIGYQGRLWTEIAKATGASMRGELNSAEDFADTFAVIYAQAVIHSGLPYRSFNSRWRQEKVKSMIEGNS